MNAPYFRGDSHIIQLIRTIRPNDFASEIFRPVSAAPESNEVIRTTTFLTG